MANAEKRAIVMADGRNLTFGKIEKVKKDILTDSSGKPTGIRFDGDNGETFVAMFSELPDATWIDLAEGPTVSVHAMAHGYSQKLGDSYASIAATADCIETARMLWSRLVRNAWNSETKGFGAPAVLLEACVRAFPQKSREEIRAILVGMSKEERDAIQVSPEVKPFYDAVMAERVKPASPTVLAKFQ